MHTSLRAVGVAVAAGTALAVGLAPTAAAAPPPASLAGSLTEAVTLGGVSRHLDALQAIATANGGNRAVGTPGYDASAAYVAAQLRAKGFQVETPSFTVETEDVNAAALAVGTNPPADVIPMTFTPNTPAGGVTGTLRAIPNLGCAPTDYTSVLPGDIAVITRGECSFGQKSLAAAAAGADAAVIVNNVAGDLNGTLGDAASAKIPTAGVSLEAGPALVAASGSTATLVIDITRTSVTTTNVIAQTTTGRTDNVVMAGSHLDSVPEGPGINDNGSGSAGLLETALQLGPNPDVENAVRFAWWSAEELGLLGAEDYVANLDEAGLASLALYLNFDMIGSPNPAYFVYDGDDSDAEGEGPGPAGSDAIEASFVDFLESKQITVGGAPRALETEGTDFDGRSDYGPFIAAGIPAGGLFTGAEDIKTTEQAAKWGGTAGVAYDPNYHQAGDTRANINNTALDLNSDALANTLAEFAASTEDVNGELPAGGPADLRVSVGAPVLSLRGTPVPITVTVTNDGPNPSERVAATALAPGYTLTAGEGYTLNPDGSATLPVEYLAAGASATVTVNAVAPAGPAFGLAVAYLFPAGEDPRLINNIGVSVLATP